MNWRYMCTCTCIRRRRWHPLQYSCLENSLDGGAWWASVHVVSKSRTQLSDFTFTFHFHALEKEMATHSSDLAWRIPGTAEPGELPSMGSHRVGHDWSDLAAAAAAHVYYVHVHTHTPWNTIQPYEEEHSGTCYSMDEFWRIMLSKIG